MAWWQLLLVGLAAWLLLATVLGLYVGRALGGRW